MSTALERGEHGVRSWRLGCRCSACRRALHRQARIWWATAQLRRGRDPASRVDPRRLVHHLEQLQRAGVTRRQLALRAGVAESTLSRAGAPGVRVSRIVERAVLGVQP